MNTGDKLRIGTAIASAILLATASGCMTYTVFSHPNVEVYDEKISKYLYTEVQLVSNCKNCHDNHASKYDLYANGVNTRRADKTSLDKIDLLKTREEEPDLRGWNNYRNSDFGYYYFAPWWFDEFAVGTGIVGNAVALPVATPSSGTGAQIRQISRRLSSEPSSSGSGAQTGSRTSSETKSSAGAESGSRQNSSETKEEKRGSGRVR